MMLWVDTETTGLNPNSDELLEIALVITTNDLKRVASTALVLHPAWPMDDLTMDPIVQKMHTKNGLFLDVAERGIDRFAAQTALLRWFADHGIESGKYPMCGSNVSFDRAFLHRHMPKLESFFHYRNIDVSTIKELSKCMNGPMFKKGGAIRHRALEDIITSIEELEFYRQTGFIGLPNNPPEKSTNER